MAGQFADGSARSEDFAQPPLSGERRQITALFYDIVDSTGLLHQLDPEDFGRAQRIIHAEAAAAIRHEGGYLDRVLGDGGCAFFGYPEATEDAAECAIAAALEFIERCRAAAPRLGIGQPIRVRAGVATGLVVLQRGEYGMSSTDEIVGLAPALASRVQAEADPDCVAVSEATYRITRLAFTFEPLGARTLKGFSGPQQLWRPVSRRPTGDRFSRQRRSELPLFARQEELDLCRIRWAQAREGAGQVIFMAGEPGIGKSRLVSALRHEVMKAGDDVRLLQCEPRRETRPLHPLEDLLRREIDASDDGVATSFPERIDAYLRREAPGSSDDASLLVSFLLDNGPNAALTDVGSERFPSPEVMQQITAGAIDLVRAWCHKGPQLLIFEDLHWADPMTLSLLNRIVDEASQLSILVVVTTRDPLPAAYADRPNVAVLSLSRLDAPTVSRFVEAIWAPSAPPKGVSSFVYERSDGVPLLIEESTRLLKERFGDSSTGVTEWEAVLRDEGVTSLHDFISARLAQLGRARRVAQIASVIGREFSYDLLAIITAGEVPSAMLDERLGQLVEAGIIHPRNESGRLSFGFRHVLIQEAAYQSVLKSERRLFHEAIVESVVQKVIAPLADDVMAWHCEQAGRFREAAQFAIKAAENCSIHSALLEAERLLASAESFLIRSGVDSQQDDLILQLLMIRGPVVTELFGPGSEQARAIYERGVEICRKHHSPDPEKWFPLYWGWWFTSANYSVYRVRAQELVRFTKNAADPEIRLQAFHCSWATDFNAGHHRDCLCRIEEGLVLYNVERARESRARYGGHDAKVCALAERGLSLWFLGDIEKAAASVDAALDWAAEIDHVGSLCHALDVALMLRRYEGDAAGAEVLVRRMAEIADEQLLTSIQAKCRIFGGWAQALTGSPVEGLRMLEAGLAKQQEIGTEEDFPVYMEMQAELLGLIGQPERGATLLDEAIARAERVGHLFWIPELYRRRALLREAAEYAESACVEDLARAIADAEAKGTVTLANRARADLARLQAS